jgi:Tol biopolymer transport system component
VAAFGDASLNGLHFVTPDDDGTSTTPFMTRQGVNTQPAWSPDGTQLAFASDWIAFDFIYDIFVTTPDGSQVTQLTNGFQVPGPLSHSAYPAWSPDGSLIAFVHGRQFLGGPDMRFHVAVMATDGSSLRDLAWAGDVSWFDLLLPGPGSLAWSPDGTGIAYTFVDCDLVLRTGCSKVRSVRYVSLDGEQQSTIVEEGDSPSWRP